MANIGSINGNSIVPADGTINTAMLVDGSVTDIKLAQSGGVLSKVGAISNEVFKTYDYSPTWELGGINLNGSDKVRSDRIRIATPLYAKAGSTFSVPSGYKLFVAVYDAWPNWTELLEYQSTAAQSQTTTKSGFVRVIIGKSDDSDLTGAIDSTASQLTASWIVRNAWDAPHVKTYDYSPTWELGGIYLNGSDQIRNDRIRTAVPLYAKAGSTFSVPSGYKIFVAVYNAWPSWTELLEYQSTASQSKTTTEDGYVRVIIGKTDDSDLTNIVNETGARLADYWVKDYEWPTPSVTDFGAVGDGVTDDTNALRIAFSAAENGTIKIPAGTYLVSGTLYVPNGCHIYGDGDASVIKLADSSTLDTWTWRSTSRTAIIIVPQTSRGCVLENFAVEGQSSVHVDKQDGIVVMGSNHRLEGLCVHDIDWFYDEWVENVRTNDAYHWAFGLYIINAENVHVRGGDYYNCSYECIGTENCVNVSILNAAVGTACRVPLQVHRDSTHVVIDGCRLYLDQIANDGTTGLTMHGTSTNPVEHVFINNCTIPLHLRGVEGGENNIFITNCYIGGAVYNVSGYYDQVWCISNCYLHNRVNLHADKVVITGNVIRSTDLNAITIDGNNVSQVGNVFPLNSGVVITGH